MIRFHKPYALAHSKKYIMDVIDSGRTEGDGEYTKKCQSWLKSKLGFDNLLLMTSGTHALECACQCLNLSSTDEVIMPSYNFPSAANAVLLAGGKIVFSEVEHRHLTLDPARIEEKITAHTKAILVIHYGGFLADMGAIMEIARRHQLQVIEDSAQCFLNPTQREPKNFGDYICYSFHGTKDVVCGEGGALFVKDHERYAYAKRFRHKGTNRDEFLQGHVAFYEWTDLGSSYSPSELLMALLYGQLEQSHIIVKKNREIFARYQQYFEEKRYAHVSFSQEDATTKTNGHTFYLLFEDVADARAFKSHMMLYDIDVRSHFVPLSNSHMANQHVAISTFTSNEEQTLGERLIRLPIYPDLDRASIQKIQLCCDYFWGGVQ